MIEKIVYCTFSGIAVVLALMTAMLWNKPYALMLASGCFSVALLVAVNRFPMARRWLKTEGRERNGYDDQVLFLLPVLSMGAVLFCMLTDNRWVITIAMNFMALETIIWILRNPPRGLGGRNRIP